MQRELAFQAARREEEEMKLKEEEERKAKEEAARLLKEQQEAEQSVFNNGHVQSHNDASIRENILHKRFYVNALRFVQLSK